AAVIARAGAVEVPFRRQALRSALPTAAQRAKRTVELVAASAVGLAAQTRDERANLQLGRATVKLETQDVLDEVGIDELHLVPIDIGGVEHAAHLGAARVLHRALGGVVERLARSFAATRGEVGGYATRVALAPIA